MLRIFYGNKLVSSRLSDLLGQLKHFPAPQKPEANCEKRETNSEDVHNVPGLFEEVSHSHLFEDAQAVNDVVEGGEDKEDLAGEGDVAFDIPLPGQTEYVNSVVGKDSSTNKFCHNLDHSEEIDLSVVEGELRDESPGPVVNPVLLLQCLQSQLQFVNVTAESEFIPPTSVLGEVSIESAGLSLVLSHVLELSHPRAVLVQQRLPPCSSGWYS